MLDPDGDSFRFEKLFNISAPLSLKSAGMSMIARVDVISGRIYNRIILKRGTREYIVQSSHTIVKLGEEGRLLFSNDGFLSEIKTFLETQFIGGNSLPNISPEEAFFSLASFVEGLCVEGISCITPRVSEDAGNGERDLSGALNEILFSQILRGFYELAPDSSYELVKQHVLRVLSEVPPEWLVPRFEMLEENYFLLDFLKNSEEILEVLLSKAPNYSGIEKLVGLDDLKPNLLEILARAPKEKIKMDLLDRENLPSSVLEILSRDDSVQIRVKLASRDDLPHRIVIRLGMDKQTSVRAAIASRFPLSSIDPASSEDIDVEDYEKFLRDLARDEDPSVRLSLAAKEDIPLSVLEVLAQDENPKIRKAIIGNINLSEEIYDRLIEDTAPSVTGALIQFCLRTQKREIHSHIVLKLLFERKIGILTLRKNDERLQLLRDIDPTQAVEYLGNNLPVKGQHQNPLKSILDDLVDSILSPKIKDFLNPFSDTNKKKLFKEIQDFHKKLLNLDLIPYFCTKCGRRHTKGKIYNDHRKNSKLFVNFPPIPIIEYLEKIRKPLEVKAGVNQEVESFFRNRSFDVYFPVARRAIEEGTDALPSNTPPELKNSSWSGFKEVITKDSRLMRVKSTHMTENLWTIWNGNRVDLKEMGFGVSKYYGSWSMNYWLNAELSTESYTPLNIWHNNNPIAILPQELNEEIATALANDDCVMICTFGGFQKRKSRSFYIKVEDPYMDDYYSSSKNFSSIDDVKDEAAIRELRKYQKISFRRKKLSQFRVYILNWEIMARLFRGAQELKSSAGVDLTPLYKKLGHCFSTNSLESFKSYLKKEKISVSDEIIEILGENVVEKIELGN
ncbi:MAG: hypothetical protein ACTSU5_19340 [Promethearchaeota archaeon]